MSKSMCGCGCSIISSLMKRLGRTACCSDLFVSHTSEQLQRLTTGCPSQPKVTLQRCPLTVLMPPGQPVLCFLCPLQEMFGQVQCSTGNTGPNSNKHYVWNSVFVYLLYLSKTISQFNNCAPRESIGVIDSLMKPGDLIGRLAALTIADLLSALSRWNGCVKTPCSLMSLLVQINRRKGFSNGTNESQVRVCANVLWACAIVMSVTLRYHRLLSNGCSF